MKRTVCRFIEEHDLLRAGDRVLVGFSGGADSTCLLHLLRSLAEECGISLRAAHLDHGMRPESAADADFAARICADLDIPLTSGRVEVPAEAKRRRQGLEETARDLRRAFLLETAARFACPVVALGHHRGDQAETVLHRLLRGSGATGLAGMRPRSGPIVRPLLAVSRGEILDYLRRHGFSWREDASNEAPDFLRNRIRHHLLPQLREFNPRVEERLAATSDRLALEEDYWRQEVRQVLERIGRCSGEEVVLETAALLALHPALRGRVLRQALAEVRGGLEGIAGVHLEAVEGVLQGGRSQAEVHMPGAWAARRYGVFRLARRPPAPAAEFVAEIGGPGEYPLPGGRVLRVELLPAAAGEGPMAVVFAAEELSFPLRIRSIRPGDRFRPAGGPGSRKIKDFFIDRKVPREERQRALVVEGDVILWLVGHRRCEGKRPAGVAPVLRLAVLSAENR